MEAKTTQNFLLGICSNKREVICAVNALLCSGFISSDISVLVPTKHKSKLRPHAIHQKSCLKSIKSEDFSDCSGIPLAVVIKDNFTSTQAKLALEGSGISEICVLGETYLA